MKVKLSSSNIKCYDLTDGVHILAWWPMDQKKILRWGEINDSLEMFLYKYHLIIQNLLWANDLDHLIKLFVYLLFG